MMSRNFRNKSIIAFFFRLKISNKIAKIAISKNHLLFACNSTFNIKIQCNKKTKYEGKKSFFYLFKFKQ
jgi:hypothetical protein